MLKKGAQFWDEPQSHLNSIERRFHLALPPKAPQGGANQNASDGWYQNRNLLGSPIMGKCLLNGGWPLFLIANRTNEIRTLVRFRSGANFRGAVIVQSLARPFLLIFMAGVRPSPQ